jgi:hypothetical protein
MFCFPFIGEVLQSSGQGQAGVEGNCMASVTKTWRILGRFALFAMVVAGAATGGAMAAGTAGMQEERYWSDPQTGLAIGGYDPVSYFVEKAPRLGKPEHELRWQGLVWRFRNEGNLAAFRDAPLVYAPRFGGFSAPALLKGVAVPGNPLIWAMQDDRLYLFYSPAHKFLWQQDRKAMSDQARAHWPDVARTIPR